MTDAVSMQQQIDALDGSTDWSDPNVYARVLSAQADGVEDDQAGQRQGDQGDTAAANPPPADSATPGAAEPAAAPAAPAAAPAASPAPAPADAPIDGVLTRDGKNVIPYGVLEAARSTARTAAERNAELLATVEQLQAQLQAKNATPPPPPASAVELTAEELADLQDVPAVGKLVKVVNDLAARVAQPPAPAAAPTAPAPAASEQDEFDAGIAANPLIADWMAAGAKGASPQWDRAIALDRALQHDPTYATKSYAERFATVQNLVAAEFGIAVPSRTPAPSPTPAPAPAAAARTPAPPPKPTDAPEPSLDELAGQAPSLQQDRWAAMNERDALAAAHSLSDAELRQLAGVLY